jgi:hypothetical protein
MGQSHLTVKVPLIHFDLHVFLTGIYDSLNFSPHNFLAGLHLLYGSQQMFLVLHPCLALMSMLFTVHSHVHQSNPTVLFLTQLSQEWLYMGLRLIIGFIGH